MKKTISLAAFLAATALAVSAQQPAKAADPQRLVDQIEVRVIDVDVVVTDRKGNFVHGLTQDDFEIFENGKPKPISNFSEIIADHAAVPQSAATADPKTAAAVEQIPDNQKRRVIFYIDNLSLNPFNRNRVFKEMKAFITEVMRPGDEAMIATWNRSMKVRVPFTRDTTQLQQTLDVIAGESALGVNATSERRDTEGRIRDADSYDSAVATARTYAESTMHDLRQSIDSLNALMSTLAGVEGKKVVVMTSEGFPIQPGREMFAFIDEIGRQKNWPTSSMLEGMAFDSHSLIKSVADTANANGITIYAIHAGGLAGTSEISAENAQATPFLVAQAQITNSTESMQIMSEMTGGTASLQTNNFAAAFDRIKRDLDSYYSIGYRAGTERVDRQRSLTVRAKNRSYTARGRRSFVEKSTFAEMNDRVIANLLYTTKQNDLKILVRTKQPRATDDSDIFRVPVEVQIPMDSLVLLPQGEAYVGGFDVYVVVGNKDNDMSDVARKSHQIQVPAAEFEASKGKYYTYSLELMMERGLNRISIGVVDAVSNTTGFSRDQVIAQDLR